MALAEHIPTIETLRAQLANLKTRSAEEQEKEKQLAFAKFNEHQLQSKKAAVEKRDKLLSVQIDRTEAAIIALEFGISKEQAETVLRQQGGNFNDAMNYLLATRPVLPI